MIGCSSLLVKEMMKLRDSLEPAGLLSLGLLHAAMDRQSDIAVERGINFLRKVFFIIVFSSSSFRIPKRIRNINFFLSLSLYYVLEHIILEKIFYGYTSYFLPYFEQNCVALCLVLFVFYVSGHICYVHIIGCISLNGKTNFPSQLYFVAIYRIYDRFFV